MKKIMISQPMNGLNEEEVAATRNEITDKLTAAGFDVIFTLFSFESRKDYKTPALEYLSSSVFWLGQADAMYFAPGWDKTRGCLIERKICELYDIEILDTIPEALVIEKEEEN